MEKPGSGIMVAIEGAPKKPGATSPFGGEAKPPASVEEKKSGPDMSLLGGLEGHGEEASEADAALGDAVDAVMAGDKESAVMALRTAIEACMGEYGSSSK